MIWKRLKKSTPEQEEEFAQRMDEVKPGFKDKVAMLISALLVLVLPSVLVLVGLCALVLWIFGII